MRREQAAVADVAVGLPEEMRQRVGRAEAMNRRVRNHREIRVDDRHGDRDVEADR